MWPYIAQSNSSLQRFAQRKVAVINGLGQGAIAWGAGPVRLAVEQRLQILRYLLFEFFRDFPAIPVRKEPRAVAGDDDDALVVATNLPGSVN